MTTTCLPFLPFRAIKHKNEYGRELAHDYDVTINSVDYFLWMEGLRCSFLFMDHEKCIDKSRKIAAIKYTQYEGRKKTPIYAYAIFYRPKISSSILFVLTSHFTKFMTLFLYKTIINIGKFWRSLITLYNHRNYNWKQQLIKSFIIFCAITARFEEMKVVDVIKKFWNDERTSKMLTMSFSYIFIMLSLHFSPLMLAWELFGNFPSLIFLLYFHIMGGFFKKKMETKHHVCFTSSCCNWWAKFHIRQKFDTFLILKKNLWFFPSFFTEKKNQGLNFA